MNELKTLALTILVSFVLGAGAGVFTGHQLWNTSGPDQYVDDDSGTEQLDSDREGAMGDTTESFNDVRDSLDAASRAGEELAGSLADLSEFHSELGRTGAELESGIEGDLEIARRIRELVRDGERRNR